MTRIGTGFVEIEPDFGPFWRKVHQEMAGGGFDRIGNDSGNQFSKAFAKGSSDGAPLAAFTQDLDRGRGKIKAVGDRAGKEFGDGIAKGLKPARAEINAFARDGAASFKSLGDIKIKPTIDLRTAGLRVQIQQAERQIRELSRMEATPEVVLRTAKAAAELERFRAKLAKMSKEQVSLTPDTGSGGGGFRGLSRDVGTFGAAAGGATATIGGFRVALAALVPITIGFGGALIAAVGALGPLIGLAASAGSALGAAAQGMGVFKLATMGVADALKEQIDKTSKSASAAVSNAGQQRASARAIQSAQEGVRTATQHLQDALRDERLAVAALGPAYTAARMRLTDMREAVIDANLSLQGAKLAADEAKRALAALFSGPDPRELADAHHAVEESMLGERDAVLDLLDAHRALQDLLKPADTLDLADATDAVTDAIRGEERARLDLNDQIAKTNAVLADPTATDDEKARARLELADAENAVGDSTRDTARARERLAQLEAGPPQAEIEAARRRVSDAEHAVGQAARATADARTQLAEVETPATAEAIAQARLDVALAENALGDAQRDRIRAVRDLNTEEQKGIDHATEVVQAREAIRRSSDAVTEAERGVTRAMQAVSDAQASAKESMASMGLAAANLDEKLNKLPPAAREFVKTLIDMKPRLDQIRQTAAAGFFPGATEGLKAASGSFDEVNQVIGQTATVLGEAARKSGELVGSPAFGRDIAIIGGNNAKVIDTLGEAMRHVISAIRNVMVAAGPLTQWLADTINKWALQASAAAKSGRETGKLADFFEKTRAIAERLGSIIGHLTSGLIGVGKAGSETGNDIWRSIDKAAKRFDEWANSDAGRQKLKDFFKDAKDLAAALIPALTGIAKGLGFLALKALPLTAILTLLGPLADEATVAFVAYKIATYAVAAAQNIVTVATKAWAAGQWLLNAALAANPIGLVVVALVAIGAALYIAWTKSETFRDIVKGAFEVVKDAFGWVLQAAKDVFGWLSDHWPLILGILTGPIGLAVLAIVKHWDDIKGLFTDGLNAVIGIIKGFATALADAGKWIIDKIVEGIKATAGALADAAVWLKNRIVEGIHLALDAFKTVGSWILNRIVDGFKAITDLLGTVGGWFRNRIEDFIRLEIEGLKNIGSWILNRVVDGFKTVTDALGSIGGWIKNRVMDIIDGAKDGFKSVGSAILDFIVDGMKGGINKLIDFINVILDIVEEIPGVKDIDPIEHLKMARGGVNGLAQGGAFARTGGIVDHPIVLMGEEAPQHPEFVIPTNPAYRDRAKGLLMQAWQTIGFARGGVYGKDELADLWRRANPGLGDANLMVAIALAESSGDPDAANGPYHGLWQVGPDGSFDPLTNAREAGDKLRTQGLRAWEAYTNGAYKKFTGGGGILGAITGAIGSLLSKGADFILSKLPSVGGLPDWLKGTGSYLIDQVTGWIKDKVSDVIGLAGGGGAVGGGVSGSIKGAMALAREMGLSITSTTGGQHTKNSWHYKGRAADVAGSPAQMAAFFNAALARYGSNLLELFYDPLGAIDNGHRIPAIGGHSDHVHIALAGGGILGGGETPPYGGSFATGGIVPGPTGSPRLIEAHAGETVLPNGMRLHADIYIGGQRINELVDVRLEMRDRASAATWRAGKA